jgi:uncharacterized membrane protein
MLIAVLAVVGLLVSTYFTAIAYRWVQPDARWIPTFCRMDEKTCASVVFTPQARVFGLPNSVLGQVYYLVLLVGVGSGWIEGAFLYVLLAASTLTVGLALYLSYSLLFVLRVPCRLCFTSHSLNIALCALLWLRIWSLDQVV